MTRKLLIPLAAVAVMALPTAAQAQVAIPYSGYNPYTNRFYQGSYTYNGLYGPTVQRESMYNPYTGSQFYGQRFVNPYSGFSAGNIQRYNPYTNTYRYRTFNNFGPVYPYGY